jgi:excinuclease ABC subunit A
MDSLRSLLAATETAKLLQLRKKHFATAQPGGRCESCKGQGRQTVSMDFLADVSRVCGACNGTGFLPNVLQCCIHGMNLVELLDQTVEQAGHVFTESKKLNKALTQLQEVGLGYLKLGQATGTLSGGERQRLHLARELLKAGRGTTLYLCDEPSAGLHELDVDLLARLFHKLVDQGHTVIMTEHHQGLIAQAHAVVEMGGVGGGLCRCDCTDMPKTSILAD